MASIPTYSSPADYTNPSLPFDIVGTSDGVLVEARDDAGLLLPATLNPVPVVAGAYSMHVTGLAGNKGAVYLSATGRVALGAPSLVQHKEYSSAGTADGQHTVTLDAPVTPGNMVLVLVDVDNSGATDPTIADSGSQSYRTNTSARLLNGTFPWLKAFWKENSTGITAVTIATSAWYTLDITVLEVSGMPTASDPFDVAATHTEYNVMTSDPTATTAQANEFLVGIISNGHQSAAQSFTALSPWTHLGTPPTVATGFEYRVVSATGQYYSLFNRNDPTAFGNLCIAFKGA